MRALNQTVYSLCIKFFHTFLNRVRTHIVHLSSASALPLIKNCRKSIGNRLTVETCHHYLNLNAENVPRNRVDFKCCPPIRNSENQRKLWQGILDGDINMIVSDHSPSTAEMKLLIDGDDYGDFMKSWGGISSIQFGKYFFNSFILVKNNSQNFNRFVTVLDEL